MTFMIHLQMYMILYIFSWRQLTRRFGLPGGARVSTDRLEGLAARSARDSFEKSQLSAPIELLEQLAGHDHALDLVGALVDLGDLGPARSFRS
jgi:hypothetical protein